MTDKPSEDCHQGCDSPCPQHEVLPAALRAAQTENAALKQRAEEAERVKDKAFLVARDADSTQKAAFEMLSKAKETIEDQLSQVEALKAERETNMTTKFLDDRAISSLEGSAFTYYMAWFSEREHSRRLEAQLAEWKYAHELERSELVKVKSAHDGLLAAMGEKDVAIASAKNHLKRELVGPGRSVFWMLVNALSTTPQDALARLRNEAKAEAFEEAARTADQEHRDGRCNENQKCVCNVLAIQDRLKDKAKKASGKREG